MSQQIF